MNPAIEIAAGAAGSATGALALAWAAQRSVGRLAALVVAGASLALALGVWILRGPAPAGAVGLAALAAVLALQRGKAAAGAVGVAALAVLVDPTIGLCALGLLAWVLPEERLALLAWAAAAAGAIAWPLAPAGAMLARAALLAMSALLAYAGRRRLASLRLSRGVRSAAFLAVALLPSLALLAMAVLQGRVERLQVGLWPALALSGLPLLAGAGALVALLGAIAILATRNDLKPIVVGALLNAVLGATLLSGRGVFLAALPAALAVGVGAEALWARWAPRKGNTAPRANVAQPELHIPPANKLPPE